MYEHGGLYVNDTEEVTNAAWEAINYDTGNVALDDDYVAEMGLPVSQRFPWDDSKGLYFMNGQHQIHCLVRFNLSLRYQRKLILTRSDAGSITQIVLPAARQCALGLGLGTQHALFQRLAARDHVHRRRHATFHDICAPGLYWRGPVPPMSRLG